MTSLRWCVPLLLALGPACYRSSSIGDDDLVITDVPSRDAGPSRDSGAPPARRDGATPAPDGFTPGPDGGRDAGPRDVCEDGETVDEHEGPGCSFEALECLESCDFAGDPDLCQQECFEAHPNCGACIYDTLISCANRQGCQEAWNTFACCTERSGCVGLRGGDRLACAEACPFEVESYGECVETTPFEDCEREIERCF